ncbi:DMT family transporter [Dongia sedimenti]|uniref:EamA family transporter n=1 Tax=Dongia sedimenti TaxID=3064282 RepID=A0ABU0YLD9_9PROT|nr:EamA family transporter [Rhodospirillaceae bacterium R-7]
MSRSHAGSLLLLLGLAVCWGYNWVVMKIGLHDAGPVAFAAIRCLGGAIILGCVLLALRRSFKIVEPWTVAAIGLLQTALAQGLIAMALSGGQAGKSAVLNYTLPVWVMILGFLFLKERPRLMQWLATAVAFGGVMVMTFLNETTISLAPIFLALSASICWGAGTVVTQSLMRRHNGRIDTVVLTAWQLFIGGVVLTALAFIVPEAPLHWTTSLVLALLYNVGPASAVAFLLWFMLQQRIEANVLSLIVLIVPLVGIAAGWLQLGERPTGPDAIGMALILAGIAVMVVSQRRKLPVTAQAEG